MLTVGGGLLTVIDMPGEVALSPIESVATAVSVCGPLVVVPLFQGKEKLGPKPGTGLPRFAPSNLNCTEAMVADAELAVAARVIGPATVALFAGRVMLTVGGVLDTVTVTAAEVAV